MEKRASADANAMMFDGADLLDAAALARKFAGDSGRIATMADVAQTRRLAEKDELIWQRPIITSSAEFYGRSRFGTPLIIVAHGVGPLVEEDELFSAYYGAYGNGPPRNGMISQEEFLRLEEGHYGPVEIVPRAEVWKRRHPFQECLTAEEAMEDPLVRARLGEMGDFYLARHRSISLDWAADEHLTTKGHECMLVNQDPQRQSYLAREPDGASAAAHLLSVSGLTRYGHGHWDDDRRHACMVTFLSCHEWGNEGWLVGFRGGERMRPHPGPGIVRERFAEVWKQLLRNGPPPLPNASRIHALMAIDNMLFTRHESSGCGPDGGEPEFPVSKAERTDEATFTFPTVNGDYRNAHCDAKAIRAKTPPWANAFRVVQATPVWKGDDPSHHVVKVDYYRIEVGYRMRVPPMARIREDFDLLLSLEA
ncbi:MAG TPA: hypothetical protein VL500_04470 [Candidatus Eisenbacteria bacterium]|nr:hypothetical protein [Candidatus Eisenbacteria bacterium]